MKLKDQVALITGSAQGMGKEIALAFAKEGGIIGCLSHSSEAYGPAKGGSHHLCTADCSVESDT